MSLFACAPPRATPKCHLSVSRVRLFLALFAILFGLVCTLKVSGIEFWIPFERAYEISDFVCMADAVEYLPADEPTRLVPETTASYRLRVLHVWKGEPPDTLQLRGAHGKSYNPDGQSGSWGFACGGPREFEVGSRYLVFASTNPHHVLPHAHTHTRELSLAKADFLELQRTKGPGRSVVLDAGSVPSVSYRSLVRDLEFGDSLAIRSAVHALRELSDSAEVALGPLVGVLERTRSTFLRRQVCNVLGRWSCEDKTARRELFAVMEHPEQKIRLAAVEANCYGSYDEVVKQVLERTSDHAADVRAAALRRSARNLRGDDRLIEECLTALSDTSAIVREEAVLGLRHSTGDSRIIQALERCLDDPHSTVAVAATRTIRHLQSRDR